MAAELRGGLSFGLSGFSFWSHDVGGFTATSVKGMDQDLFARWLAFGMLSSHSRCHGIAPKEPWLYGTNFMDEFRMIDEMKYKLMPYVYAQAKDSSEHGLPMVRALFVEFPDDPDSWTVDDEYLYGSSILVAPLLHENEMYRNVYLPPGTWIDYQSGKNYSGGWQKIGSRKNSGNNFWSRRNGSPKHRARAITMEMDWSKIELVAYAKNVSAVKGLVYLPDDSELHELTLDKRGGNFKLVNDPLAGKVAYRSYSKN